MSNRTIKEGKRMTDISTERRNQLWAQAQVNGKTDDDLYARLLEREEKSMTTNKVQCADCWAWIDRDKNHTCRAQIQRNRKAEKK